MQIVKIYTDFGRAASFIALIVFALGLISCSGKQEGKVLSREFEGEVWHRFDYLEATYTVTKAPMTADLVMDIYVTDVYPNIYPYHYDEDGIFTIALSVSSPDGGKRSREFRFRLKDKDGNFKSQKEDGFYHFELPLINEMSFSENGEYHFKIENKYPKEPLYGIKSLNVNCLGKKIKTK